VCEEYQGWTNRETWATALWINNDFGIYQTVQEMAQDIIKDDSEERKAAVLAETIEAMFDDAFGDIAEMSQEGLNMLKDIGSLYRVNWREIASSLLSEVNA